MASLRSRRARPSRSSGTTRRCACAHHPAAGRGVGGKLGLGTTGPEALPGSSAPVLPPAQIVPLWVVIGVAGGVCGGFMFKYFSSHTEVNWSKKNRMTHDNQGIGDCSSHNSHFGMRKANKHHVTMFPFGFEPMQGAQHIQITTCSLAGAG